ncbi:MAG: hypothetical protein AUG50_05980 [Betaproteobacteria bacterium 13_1_20CM_3_63_8]|nr:MAG: hypothetical protein AUG50_05980 [Betaproteobacteria bacterium 13_1_20CM_3_63_8]
MSRADLVGAKHDPNLVIKNFGGRARQRVEPRRLQLTEEFDYRDSQRLRTLVNFQRRKRVHLAAPT